MKKLLLLIGIAALTTLTAKAQQCKVLDPNIQGTYEGMCRKGLANGKGTSIGKDTYSGKFYKGMKQGNGKYQFANGDIYVGDFFEDKMHGKGKLVSDSTELIGFWKYNEFVGTEKSDFDGYKIINASNTNRKPSFRKVGDGRNLTIEIRDINRSVSDFKVPVYSSGTIGDINNVNGGIVAQVLNVEFPFSASIRYRVPNKSNNFMVDVDISFEITEPGNWRIISEHE
ncbi:MAG: hypothetical protein JW798_07455 [Prolixibacteraceae bacterium]|nr:hypothetical protein [Prolixibacteraceae bacterium]